MCSRVIFRYFLCSGVFAARRARADRLRLGALAYVSHSAARRGRARAAGGVDLGTGEFRYMSIDIHMVGVL